MSDDGSFNTGQRKAVSSKITPAYELANSDHYLGVARRHLTASISEHEKIRQFSCSPAVDGPKELQKLVNHRLHGSPGGVLAALSEECWADILYTYDEEIGLQYPFLDIADLQRDISQAVHQRADGYFSQHDQISDIATLILAVVAIFTDSDSAEISNALVQNIFTDAIARTHLAGGDRQSLSLLTLTSIYFFLTDREILAWRGIGTVSRLLQELRGHRNDDLPHMATSASPKADDNVSEKMYWTVYTLDRRWSFGTGLPFSIQDTDVRHYPQFSDDSLSALYLEHMVIYCGITSEVRRWCLDAPLAAAATANSMCDLLCFRVIMWQRNLPAKLQFRGLQDAFDAAKESRGTYKIRLTLYLRANQMRTVIYRKAAVRPGTRDFDPSHANIMAATAQDTVRILDSLARSTNIYQTQQKTFNHFLETALSSLLLVLCCSVDPENRSCLDEVFTALELVRQLSTRSSVSRRLQDKLQTFQAVVTSLQAEMQHAGTVDISCGSANASPGPTASASVSGDLDPVASFRGPLANGFSVPVQPVLPLQTTAACCSSSADCETSNVPLFRCPELTDYLMGFNSSLFI
ncbi:fungal specific transcription factor domain containing protein [Grosmannia clavigera kw1407]|uniref:Fungal specific transcription factor domain containing protein n=1 Tax=Grosmannia clavigera (strain kw1407 / UAMH 11150) TaxID=655863 RepID=F0XQY6_GROCL|nr:fungal specific transcription factor domain containing protein [Grosmannia clavigera kw1407]EFW99796.1 fungal specific transcription factor domain containing protein [Grosmannia clavigera kw1407]